MKLTKISLSIYPFSIIASRLKREAHDKIQYDRFDADVWQHDMMLHQYNFCFVYEPSQSLLGIY